jgi:predicted lipoprotein with Yx(FWY)xxD motif
MKKPMLSAIAALAAVLIAACGSSASTSSTTAKTASKPASSGSTVAVGTTKLGKILVGPNGRTLYEFLADKGKTSTCFTACATEWPPLTVTGSVKAGPGINASLLGTTARTAGVNQVTYDGHPLYYYVGDGSPGQTTGQGVTQFGALWYVLSPAGTAITTTTSTSSGY